jgi:hypothetical protein
MAGDLNAKHVDWNSRLTTTRGKLLRDYASRNSCLIYGPDSPTTLPYNSSATPDVLDIVITKDLTFPVYLTACSARSSDHLPVLIDTTCRSSFRNLPARPDYRRTDWVKFQASLEERLPSSPYVRGGNVQCNFGGAGGVDSQESPSQWPTAPNTSTYSGWNTPEE